MRKKNVIPGELSIITTYRCPMHCKMCNIWQNPSDKAKEIKAEELLKLPDLTFVNITGGEPFEREDLEEIVKIMFRKSKRIVISTSGWYVDRIIKLVQKYPKLGIRVSIEGLSVKNDELRGRTGSFDRGIKVLLELKKMGIKDIGFGITVSDNNSEDMLLLYQLSQNLKFEFATAAVHNSYYFHKYDNTIKNVDEVCKNFNELAKRLLKERNIKSWFRAFFNMGLINYIKGGKRMLPCEAGSLNFFLDPYGEVYPCNGLEDKYWKKSMGNLRNAKSFEELWESKQAEKVRENVKSCPKNCWMIGSAKPVMKKYIRHPLSWVIANKINSMLGKAISTDKIFQYNVGQDPQQGSLKNTYCGNLN